MRINWILPLALVTSAAACSDVPTRVLVSATGASLDQSDGHSPRQTAAERWNQLTQVLVGRNLGAPGPTARAFALVSVAQYNAVVAAKDRSESAAAAGAAAAVLSGLFPNEQPAIDGQFASDAAYFEDLQHLDAGAFTDGAAIGRAAAASVLARAAHDRSDAVWTGTVPVGPGLWFSAPPPATPVTPLWGQVLPWAMSSGDQFRPSPPPAFGSPEYLSALAEVRHYSDTRTPEQLAIAQFWGNTANGGVMAYWGDVGLALMATRRNEYQSTRMLALMYMSVMDASIGCWDGKYHYWFIRPWQADAAITTPVGRPNFPSYPSAHSCLSAAAAGVLANLFPSQSNDLAAKVTEAGWARIYAGLHYKFDVDAGHDLGYSVSALVLQKAPKEHQPIPLDW